MVKGMGGAMISLPVKRVIVLMEHTAAASRISGAAALALTGKVWLTCVTARVLRLQAEERL